MDIGRGTVIVCSCEDTMDPDAGTIARGCGAGRVKTAQQLCRAEIDLFRAEAGRGAPLMVGCTQEAPLFRETAEDMGFSAPLAFANIRETAGWSADAARAGPKMAALLAAAAVEVPPAKGVELTSEGVVLVYGRDEVAIEAGRRLADVLDVTVILTRPRDVPPPRRTDFPVHKGTVRTLRGVLGGFEITLDDYAPPSPSSRGALAFPPGRNGAVSKADILLDLSGGPSLVPAADLRDGYIKADPGSPAAVAEACLKAAALVGTFEKPRYIAFREDLCAHSRSRIVGCRRCLDLCPTGAITPAGPHVAIDPQICAGCGACAAACPTGAASYDHPAADVTLARLRALLTAYRAAGGEWPVVLVHDGDHGDDLIDAAARFGAGLPANVLPLGVNEVTQVGPEFAAAAFAYGAAGVRFLTRARPKHDVSGLERTAELGAILAGALGYGTGGVGILATDDPDALTAALASLPLGATAPRPSAFAAAGGKREILALSFREMHRVAPEPADLVALPAGAPFGRVDVRVDGCTLCLACVSACPTGALKDNPDRPMLRFDEAACVQCGLCAATCPEKVITLEPRINFPAFGAPPVTIKEEEPFCCTECGKPFGTKSAIDRVVAKLEGRHWMFSGANASRLAFLKMCEDCRVQAATNAAVDPYAAKERPPVRTTEDYIREREAGRRAAEAAEGES
ncbi:4Fe-4S binding protein [Prosthecomicrobium sp. N25]|uniref:4Fe-4S binding protein n=1 Tax=Prosthecomicrobium sp. N25 TaxID=3129254 RepID=UPI0030787CF5